MREEAEEEAAAHVWSAGQKEVRQAGGTMIARRSLAGLLTIGIAFALAAPAWASEAFGVESFEARSRATKAVRVGGPDLQAGSHPDAITTSITFNHIVTGEEEGHLRVRTYGDPKDIEVNLPQG